MTSFIRTNSEHEDFISLVRLLDADLAKRDGEDHAFYDAFNKIAALKQVVVVYDSGEPVACGAIKEYDPDTMEVKRMYVLPDRRRQGFASGVLQELENWIRELSYHRAVLETGKNQPEALALYQRNGYHVIPNYGQYTGIDNSVCFEKTVNQ